MRHSSGIEITVVLSTCDRAQQARSALRSLLAQRLDPRWNYEVVVVDDGSSDDTPVMLEDLRTDAPVPMRVLRTAGIGVAGARNLGARAATGRWIAYFDDDQIASPLWLQALRLAAERTGGRCIGGALALKLPEGPPTDLRPRARALLGEHLLGKRIVRYPRKWVPASNNVLILREVLLAAGGFDERFLQGGSDTDFFRRLQDSGEELWFAPAAYALHVISTHRLRPEYLRWTGLKVGAASARILMRRRGFFNRAAEAALRCGLALLRDAPALCFGTLIGSRARVLDSRCSLWYTQGLLRGLTAGWAPRILGGQRFLESLNFRRHGGERRAAPQTPVGGL